MNRSTFFAAAGVTACAVALVALFSPATLLESKGVVPTTPTCLWLRELGVLLMALGFLNLVVRNHEDSRTLRAVLLCNALVHVGLFPLEILAWLAGTITKVGGIVPNSILHLVLAAASFGYARAPASRTRKRA